MSGIDMSAFIEKLVSGKYPKLQSLWEREFSRLADEFFGRLGSVGVDFDEAGGLEDEFDETAVEGDLNTEIEALRADLARAEGLLGEERARHELSKRELGVVKSELKACRYQLDAVRSAMDRSKWHGEPIG